MLQCLRHEPKVRLMRFVEWIDEYEIWQANVNCLQGSAFPDLLGIECSNEFHRICKIFRLRSYLPLMFSPFCSLCMCALKTRGCLQMLRPIQVANVIWRLGSKRAPTVGRYLGRLVLWGTELANRVFQGLLRRTGMPAMSVNVSPDILYGGWECVNLHWDCDGMLQDWNWLMLVEVVVSWWHEVYWDASEGTMRFSAGRRRDLVRDGGCFWAELEARDTMRQVLFLISWQCADIDFEISI